VFKSGLEHDSQTDSSKHILEHDGAPFIRSNTCLAQELAQPFPHDFRAAGRTGFQFGALAGRAVTEPVDSRLEYVAGENARALPAAM